jgi:mannose-6-phosphate isomerase-like protein (cupin superfamily)
MKSTGIIKSTDRADYQQTPRPFAGMAKDFADGVRIEPHRHPRAQLTWAVSGVMSVTADRGTWVVPPNRALWIPAETEHAIRMSGPVAMRAIYIDRAVAGAVAAECKVILVSPLLRALMLELAAAPLDYDEAGRVGHVAALFVDEIRVLDAQPLHVPMPADKRLRRCATRCCAIPPGARHWTRGRSSPAPAAAPWRDCSSTKPACGLSRGGIRCALPKHW